MARGKTEKVMGYACIVPSAVLLILKMTSIFLGLKFRKRKLKIHFLEGIKEAGVSSREAEKIVRECFDGRDKESD